jgi:hypothetical protein
MHVDKEKFKKQFPNLAAEFENDAMSYSINSVRTDADASEKVSAKSFKGYNPGVIDFIRRCDTNQQAEEIIKFLEARGEIPVSYTNKIRKQLKDKGVRSFGPKKENDYYLKHGGSG